VQNPEARSRSAWSANIWVSPMPISR
jgi:hypothetical protein